LSLLVNFAKEMVAEAGREYHHLRVRALDSMGFLTYRCTSRCRTCTIWKREGEGRDELDLEQWRTVIARLADYGVRSFEVFGGDALLRKDVIFDLIRHCQAHGIETYFPTNANLCDRETVQQLIDAGLGTVYLSIDDVEEAHDEVRGVDGTFARVRQTLDDFCRLRGDGTRPKIIVCVTLSKMNFRNFPKLIEFLEGYPVNAVYPRPLGEFSGANIEASTIDGLVPEPYFAPSDGESHLMDRDELREMRAMISRVRNASPKIYINWRSYYSTTDETFLQGTYPHRHCHIATSFVTVNPNGDVVPCPFFRQYVLGNLAESPLQNLWGNEKHRRFLKLQQQGGLPICKNCNMRVYYPSFRETFDYYIQRCLERSGIRKI